MSGIRTSKEIVYVLACTNTNYMAFLPSSLPCRQRQTMQMETLLLPHRRAALPWGLNIAAIVLYLAILIIIISVAASNNAVSAGNSFSYSYYCKFCYSSYLSYYYNYCTYSYAFSSSYYSYYTSYTYYTNYCY